MRALIATAGLLVLAGTASADTAAPHTLVRNGSGPIAGVVQDGGTIAWLAGSKQGCNSVHQRRANGSAQTLPAPAAGSMTCHWDLADGHPQLALAAKSSAVLWTLHESGSVPFDYVMTAQAGGSEHEVDRLAHASDGTGLWLGSVAGAGATLAYSYADVEYVDKLACLSGGSCRRQIAGGGIKLVAGGQAAPLTGAGPALELATASGRVAYVPASAVGKTGQPEPNATAAIEVVNGADGTAVCKVQPNGIPLALALSGNVLAVLTHAGRRDRISWYDTADGSRLGSVSVSSTAAPELTASDSLAVVRVGRTLRGVTLASTRLRTLAKAAATPVGLSLQGGRLAWAENLRDGSGRIRVLAVG